MWASLHRPDSSPFAPLFLFASSICGITAAHVQGRTSVLPEGAGDRGAVEEGGWRDDAAQMEAD